VIHLLTLIVSSPITDICRYNLGLRKSLSGRSNSAS